LPKEAGKEALRECIRAVREGETWIHSSAASRLAERLQMPDMTPREVDVLQFVVAGKSNKEIGQLLNVTEGTVKVHVNHIFAKLGVDGRVAATLLALQRGIVHLPVTPAPKPASGDPPAKSLAR
jgi:two-component system, NarL family, response regulator